MAETNPWPHGFGVSPAVIDLGAGGEIAVSRINEVQWHSGDAPGVELTFRLADWYVGGEDHSLTLTDEQAYELANVLIVLSGGERMQT